VSLPDSTDRGDGAPGAVDLREATPEDDAFLRDLYAGVRAPELAAVPWTESEKRLFCDRQYALQDRHYRDNFPGARCLVVSAESTPIGRVFRAAIDRTLYLLDIALVPEARGHGIGTTLMRALVAEADRDGLTIVLHVEPDNPAKRLYARFAFAEGAIDGVYMEMTRAPGNRRTTVRAGG
jgi:ribosomal protein S18 acetylase RimI-like enzyme